MSIVKITSVFEIAKRGNAVNPFTIEEAELELSALREAGEKMAKQLKDLRGFQEEAEARGQSSITVETEYIFNTEDAAALEAWEAANK